VDGPIHNNQVEADRARQDILEVLGLNILRINTEMAESNLTGVISNIRQRIEELKIKINEFPTTFMGVGLGARVRNDDKKTLENL